MAAAWPAEARSAKAEPASPKRVSAKAEPASPKRVSAKAGAADKPLPPGLPLATFWSVDLKGAVSAPPVSEGDRVFIALTSAQLTARAVGDGRELWRIEKNVTTPMAADAGLLFVAGAESIEALRVADGGTAWIAPRITTVAPLVARAGWVIAVTDTEILAIRAKDGQVAWRHAAGGVELPPDVDGDHLYAGAKDGRVIALTLSTGKMEWETFLELGVTAIAARAGRVYAGAGDKRFYCLDARSGSSRWSKAIGSLVMGRIAVDEEQVYFSANNNVVYALDRSTGNQKWKSAVSRRPYAGVTVLGHVVFVPAVAPRLVVLYDLDGNSSGNIPLPGDIQRDFPPEVRETAAGLQVFAVTGGLANEWQLTFLAPADEAAIVPPAAWTVLPGVPFLTDPELGPVGTVLGELLLGDPPLRPVSQLGWPVVLQDPPLEPLTTLPGLQLRPLSPVLPIRRVE